MVTDIEETTGFEHGDFIVGPALTQEELLRRKSDNLSAGTLAGDEREDARAAELEQAPDARFIPDAIADGSIWTEDDEEFIADDSPYRTMWDPNSEYYYCWEQATPEEKQALTELHEESVQAEQAVDESARQATDGKPAAETVVDARIAKENESIQGADTVVKYGKPADTAKATTEAANGRAKREFDRETQRLIRAAGTKEEKMAILRQRSPELAAEVERKAAQELARRNGTTPAPVTTAPNATSTVTAPTPAAAAQTGANTAVVSPTTEFNTVAPGTNTPAPAAPSVAQEAGSLYLANRTLYDVSPDDNLDDPDSKYNSSLWYALDKKPDLVKAYDDSVDKQEAACDAADATLSADNFLAERQSTIDRKLAINEIVAFDYSGHNRTEEVNQAQAERTKLLDEQKKLTDLKAQMEGKSEPEKAELLKAAFPPDAKAGQQAGIFEKYMAGKSEEDPKPAAGTEPDPDCCSDDSNYFNDWVLNGNWYDTGSACSVYDLPGGIQAPACTLTPTFTAVASAAQPAGTDPKLENTLGTSTPINKPPSVVA